MERERRVTPLTVPHHTTLTTLNERRTAASVDEQNGFQTALDRLRHRINEGTAQHLEVPVVEFVTHVDNLDFGEGSLR